MLLLLLLLFCLYFRPVSLEDETDKTDDNQMLNDVRSTIGDKKVSSCLNLLHNAISKLNNRGEMPPRKHINSESIPMLSFRK